MSHVSVGTAGGKVGSTYRREVVMDRRARLVTQVGRSVGDERVLAAIASVPREMFVDLGDVEDAYVDTPLSIGHGQTISQPTMVGIMLEALLLNGTERVLEVGAGSGYQAALLGRLCRSVVSTEVVPELADRARRSLRRAGIDNVTVVFTPDELGAPDLGPYDAVIVAAAAPSIPLSLIDQLKVGGRLAIPIGPRDAQVLVVATRTTDGYTTEVRDGCRFVPLVGPWGYGGVA